eukprot:359910-Chlamydomonas_euryale.AAC.3
MDGHCQSSTCGHNLLSPNNPERNCNMERSAGRSYDQPFSWYSTSVQGSNNCPVADTSKDQDYNAVCLPSAYAYATPCTSTHCLGRVICFDPTAWRQSSGSTYTRVPCDGALALYDGTDCVFNGNSGNYKLCSCF